MGNDPAAGTGAPELMERLLEGCRMSFGPAPRAFAPGERWYLSPMPPLWLCLNPRDPIWTLYRERLRVLRSGKVFWGALVQANTLLFEPGSTDCPAAAVFSTDPSFDSAPGDLARIGQELFNLKGTTPPDPALRKLAHDITDEMERSFNLSVPHVLTGGRQVYYTTLMVHRRHLPRGYLTQGLFPLVADPGSTAATLILPSRYWGPELRYFWEMRQR